MPTILAIQGATRSLGKSQGYTGLPVRDEMIPEGEAPQLLHYLGANKVDGDNVPSMVTAWQLTPDEIDRISKGATLYLHLVGVSHPPVMLVVGDVPE